MGKIICLSYPSKYSPRMNETKKEKLTVLASFEDSVSFGVHSKYASADYHLLRFLILGCMSKFRKICAFE